MKATDAMKVFESYSDYYDFLYRDKDYEGEADYVHGLIEEYAPKAESILELGCGTGKHAILLAKKGYSLECVDSSERMLDVAKESLAKLPEEVTGRVRFMKDDIRTVRLNKTFDAVISLFHVISYQTANEDLEDAFATASEHLKPGGVFIFDCWYGPAVLSERPSVRVKRIKGESIELTRIAEPTNHDNENRVDVNYEVTVHDKSTDRYEVTTECHRMRYLFTPEVKGFLSNSGMEMIFSHEWLTKCVPGTGTWSVSFGGRKL